MCIPASTPQRPNRSRVHCAHVLTVALIVAGLAAVALLVAGLALLAPTSGAAFVRAHGGLCNVTSTGAAVCFPFGKDTQPVPGTIDNAHARNATHAWYVAVACTLLPLPPHVDADDVAVPDYEGVPGALAGSEAPRPYDATSGYPDFDAALTEYGALLCPLGVADPQLVPGTRWTLLAPHAGGPTVNLAVGHTYWSGTAGTIASIGGVLITCSIVALTLALCLLLAKWCVYAGATYVFGALCCCACKWEWMCDSDHPCCGLSDDHRRHGYQWCYCPCCW